MERLGHDYLDVREFQRRGLFRDQEVVIQPLLRWPKIVQIRVSRARILVKQNCQFLQRIPVSWTRCNFGGVRPWFKCDCGKRVAKLYKSLGAPTSVGIYSSCAAALRSKGAKGAFIVDPRAPS
jgi:hypothetical protein